MKWKERHVLEIDKGTIKVEKEATMEINDTVEASIIHAHAPFGFSADYWIRYDGETLCIRGTFHLKMLIEMLQDILERELFPVRKEGK